MKLVRLHGCQTTQVEGQTLSQREKYERYPS